MTTPHDDAGPPRSIDLEIEVAGTPEQVWEAIATGRGIAAWLHPTEVQEREGGRFAFDMGSGMNESGSVSGWDPPRRFATEGVRWQPQGDGPAAELATEWVVEARGGGRCVVRMVMTGFGTGAAWDDEIEGMTGGMRAALESLRSHLAGAAPGSAAPRHVLAGVAVADMEAALGWWARLLGRPADDRPMEGLADWRLSATSSIQLILDRERAGGGLMTLEVDDLKGYLATITERGLTPGTLDETTSDTVLFAGIADPEGNRITLVEQR